MVWYGIIAMCILLSALQDILHMNHIFSYDVKVRGFHFYIIDSEA